MAKALGNFFITVTEKHCINRERRFYINSKISFPRNVPSIKIISISEVQKKKV